MDTWEANAKLNDAAVQITGERHCRSCDKFRKVDGGKWRVQSDGRKRWRCKTCTQRKNEAGFR